VFERGSVKNNIYTFAALRHLILSGLDRQLTSDDIENILLNIAIRRTDYLQYVVGAPGSYFRNSVARSEFAELLVLTWLPGQQSPIHGHAASNCGVRVLEGYLTEALYRAVEAGRGDAYKVGESVWQPGLVVFSNHGTIHKITNEDREERLVTLHLYSPPLEQEEMKIYSAVTSRDISWSAKTFWYNPGP